MSIKKFLSSVSVSGLALLMLAPTVSANSMHHMKGMHHHTRMTRTVKMPKRHMKMHRSKKMRKMHKMHMNMRGSKAPRGLKVAKHAKFHKGEHVIVKADHMKGMKGAHGKVVGVFKTRLYEVDYRSTTNHKLVKNHKWVIGREIKAHKTLHVGEHVRLAANHMVGMYGAKAKIVAVHRGPAYMINYRPTNNKHITVTNHKWIAQDELQK